MGFLKSPVDVNPWEPLILKDAEVPPEGRESFEKLCDEFADIFSKDSSDLGKPLSSRWTYRLEIVLQ